MTFILLLSRHHKFGWIADPWLAEPFRDRQFRLLMRCSAQALAEEASDERSSRTRIVELAVSCHDQELTRRFAPQGTNTVRFLQTVTEETITRHIRPYIDKRIDEMLALSIGERIPVYLRPEGELLNPSMEVIPHDQEGEPWFCFSRTAGGTRYTLEIFIRDQLLNLRQNGTVVLTDVPCRLIHQGRLIRFRDGFEGKKLVPFLTKEFISVPPATELKFFQTFFLKTLKTGQIRAEGFTVTEVNPRRRMQLSFETDWQGKPVLIVWYHYDDRKVMRGNRQHTFTGMRMEEGNYSFFRISRDFAWEQALCDKCLAAGLVPLNDSTLGLPGNTGIAEVDRYRLVGWINRNRAVLDEIPVTIRQEGSAFFLGTVNATLTVTSGEDWFDVDAVVGFGDLQVLFIDLKDHIINGIREFILPDGQVVILPEEWFVRYHDLFAFAVPANQKLRLPGRHFRLVATLEGTMDAETGKQIHQLERIDPAGLNAPEGFSGILRPYQSEGLAWMRHLHRHGFGGILADDMGLGKTIQTLALILGLKDESGTASLVVMPASLIHNWKNEAARFAPSLRIMIHTGAQRTRHTAYFNSVDLVLTTYGICRNDAAMLAGYPFNYIILDESQVIRNPEAQISRAVFDLNARYRLVLTGTPIKNTLTDLWSQMQFLNPGLLGNLTAFRKLYVNTFDPDKDEQKGERLKRLVAPFILRRKKTDVEPDLPDLTIEYRYCEMTDAQQKRYETEKSAIRNELLAGIEDGSIPASSVQVLRALIRMRQTACHPRLVDDHYQGDSGKLDEVIRNLDILREEGHKVLIFSSFVEHLKILEERFREQGWDYCMLTGSTHHREAVIRRFRSEPGCHFFLISLKAGGVGLNLTEAGYVFLLDPWWNAASELQAINRAHRIGQDKKVIAYKFISKETIEEKMLLLQQRKQALADAFVPAGNPLKDMTRSEAGDLFR